MKTFKLVIGSSTFVATIIASVLSALAGQICTTDGKTWECKDDGQGSSKPSCVNNGPFECSKPAPAGFVPGFTYTIGEFVPSDTGTPAGDGSGSRTLWEPTSVGEQFSANKVNIELALTCGIGSKKVTNEKDEEYCQSTDIGG